MSKRNLKARNLRPARDPDHATERCLQSLHTDDIDGLTVPFQGASDVGVMPGPDTQPFTVDNVREIGYRTWDLVLGVPRDQALEPLPPHWDPEPVGHTLGSWRDAHAAIRCEYNAADHITPIPCSAEHRDPHAMTFRGLWRSAQAAGWHLDTFGRRVCPDCQMTPEYRTLYPLAIWADGTHDARQRNEITELGPEEGPTSVVPREFALAAIAETRLHRDVLDTARHGRHRKAGAA